MAIPPWPAAGRPRERLAAHGAHHLSDAELVALGRQAFGGLAARERDACLGGTAARLWGIASPR